MIPNVPTTNPGGAQWESRPRFHTRSPSQTTTPKISNASSLLTMPSKGLMKPIPSVQLLLKAQPAALTPGPTGVGSEGP